MYHFRYVLKNKDKQEILKNRKYASSQQIPHRLRKQTHASLFMPHLQTNAKVKGTNYVETCVK